MDKNNIQDNLEDKYLLSNIKDIFKKINSKNSSFYTNFLDEHQVDIVQKYIDKNNHRNFIFYGGYSQSERNILGIFPEVIEPQNKNFPLSILEISYKNQYKLNHRDFLGCLMSLQINRNVIGDIIVNEGRAFVIVHSNIKDFIINNINKVGNVGIEIVENKDYCFEKNINLIELTGVISSLRLDCLVSFISKLSRKKACRLIKNNYVKINGVTINKITYNIKFNDVIVIKLYGKYIFKNFSLTKKGRYLVNINKYS